jgi:hypothetical protein
MKTTRTALPKAQKGCNYKKAQRVNARRKFWNSDAGQAVKKVGIGVGTAGAAIGAYAKNAFGVKDKVKDLMGNKKGGAVKTLTKKQRGGATWTDAAYQGVTKTTPTRGGGTKEKSFTKLNGYAGQSGYLTKTKRDADGVVIKETKKSISPKRVDRVEKRVESKIQRKGGPVKTMKRGGLVARKR